MHFKKYLLTLAALIGMFGSLVHGASQSPVQREADSEACRHWVDSVYNSLTERERVAQLVFPKVVTTQGATTKAALKRLVERGGVGGILFTEGSIAQYVEMTNYAQSIAKVPLLMTFDGEWGLAMRIKNTTRFPNNMAIGAARDSERLSYLYGKEMGRQCKAIGIQVNFAPVADVNSNASNPVIGYRSFGENAAEVSRLVNAYSKGLEESGVQAVAKHFPGHGDTNQDSHETLPSLAKTMAQLEETEMVPFRSYVSSRSGSGVMMAHLAIKSIDRSGTPMSLSPAAYRLLRDNLGFDGLIYTDALGMKGAVMPDGSNATIAALKAGADVLLSPRNPLEDIDAIMAQIKAGKISPTLIEDRCKRVLTYKYLLGLGQGVPQMNLKEVEKQLCSPAAEEVNHMISAAVITALVNRNNTLPLGNLSDRKIAVVTTSAADSDDFVEMCRRYAPIESVYKQPLTATDLRKLGECDNVVFCVTNNKAAAKTTATQLSRLDNVISVFMVNPYKMAEMATLVKASEAVVLAYDDTPLLQRYAAQAVFGGINVDGRLPVTLRGLFERGAGIDLKKTRLGYTTPAMAGMRVSLSDSIDNLMKRAIDRKAIPGAQVLIARHGQIVLDRCYGLLGEGEDAVSPFNIYDLASVSKAIGTLPGVMLAVDKGLMNLDSPLSDYIPGLKNTDKENLTVREFLFHETGMAAALNMFTLMMDTATYTGTLTRTKPDAEHPVLIQKGLYGHKDARLRKDLVSPTRNDEFPIEMAEGMYVGAAARDTIMGRIYNSTLRPTKDYNYSCLNFALLMDGEQHATGIPHEVWCDSLLWKPLGAWTMGYRPNTRFDKKVSAPTEVDTYLRKQHLRGYVHDEMADFFGGVSGNAGLFSNADDIAKICQMWLNGGTYGGVRIISPETVRTFTTTVSPTCRRGLGFDKPDTVNPSDSPTTELANASTYGHLGFTGTVFWVDPENDMIVIFLTNRVNPTRDNSAFAHTSIRPEIMKQAILAIEK